MSEQVLLSVVTPTYNRADLLGKCYESLKKQTDIDFEWIIVDDGSKDNTREVCEKIVTEEKNFNVTYVWKENGGKHTALNASHPYLHGKYVLILDSDDFLTEDAVEIVRNGWNKYQDNRNIGLITFLRKNKDHEILAYAKDENIPVDILNYQRVCVHSSDCCEVIRTSLFTKYKFPVYRGERFVAETALWYKVGQNYKTVYINKAIYVCEYLDGGLTDSGRKLRIKNPEGGMYTSHLRMNPRCNTKERIRAGLLYVCYGRFAKYPGITMVKKAKGVQPLVALCLVPGTLVYLLWKKKYL